MPLGDLPTDVPAENQSFLGSQAQAPGDNLNQAALGMQRDPASGRWTYHSTLPPLLTTEELGSMTQGQLRGQIYRDTQTQFQDYINAGLAKQAEAMNYGEASMAMTEDAMEGFGTQARRRLGETYERTLAKVDPRMAGTTISSAQRGAATRDYRDASADLEQQIAQTRVNVMQPEYRNLQQIITSREDVPPDMNAMNRMMFESGQSGAGNTNPDSPEAWEGPLYGAAANWAMTPGGPNQGSPLEMTINSLMGWDGGWGSQQQGGGYNQGGYYGGGGNYSSGGPGYGGGGYGGGYSQGGGLTQQLGNAVFGTGQQDRWGNAGGTVWNPNAAGPYGGNQQQQQNQGGWFGPNRGLLQQGVEAGSDFLFGEETPFVGPVDQGSTAPSGGREGGFLREAGEWIEEQWDDVLAAGAAAYQYGGAAYAAGSTALQGAAAYAAPFAVPAGIAYGAYELYQHNREDIDRGVETVWDQTRHEVENWGEDLADVGEEAIEDVGEFFSDAAEDVVDFFDDLFSFGGGGDDWFAGEFEGWMEGLEKPAGAVGEVFGDVSDDVGDFATDSYRSIRNLFR